MTSSIPRRIRLRRWQIIFRQRARYVWFRMVARYLRRRLRALDLRLLGSFVDAQVNPLFLIWHFVLHLILLFQSLNLFRNFTIWIYPGTDQGEHDEIVEKVGPWVDFGTVILCLCVHPQLLLHEVLQVAHVKNWNYWPIFYLEAHIFFEASCEVVEVEGVPPCISLQNLICFYGADGRLFWLLSAYFGLGNADV